ncbi:SUKH-4 family immunity protein [Streptomyces gilvifuscus]|uniref:SUKH-4 family immunity protein n=1 Tax=Streptomyces gilvifuscus TaxID=1550617 RepID=A0ABT5G255_9ACTN|nr:SUKH-4 family immunity protein [Streptomyces gilvifuscus]MDC2958786.1 SUKH-4 family immunity protein [Streptomyces gilvifuscus]
MTSDSGSQEAMGRLRAWVDDPAPKYGFLFVDGPGGSGKSALLRDFAEARPNAVLVDAAGVSTEAVLDSVMKSLGVSYGDYRGAEFLTDEMEEQDPSHSVVVVSNTQWAGQTRSTTEPWHTAEHLAGNLGLGFRDTGVRFVIEIDSTVQDLSPRNRDPLLLEARPRVLLTEFDSLPARCRSAILALALSEPRRVRFEEWQALCSLLGVDFTDNELRALADESPFVSVTEDDFPVSLTFDADARALRRACSPEKFQAFQNAVVERLSACADDDPLADYRSRALPAHAAVAGRFEELLSDPGKLATCRHTALVEALPVAYPDGVPAGTFAADLHYLDALGVAPASHAEWLSLLHLVALSQGDTERARALTESADALPWRTVWTNWRAPGRLHRLGPDIPAVKRISASAHTVTTTFADRTSLEWDASSGQRVESDNSLADIAPSPPLWHAEDPSWNLLRLRLSEDPAFVRAVQAPSLWAAACVGRLVVMAGDRGLYAVEPDAHRSGSTGLPALPSVGPRCKIRPRPFDKTACEPTRARVNNVFTAETTPTLSDEQLPSGLTHEPTRRFLKEVGFPAVSGFYGLDTHHLLDTGLVKHAWEGTKAFRTPVGDGPFYTLGSWIGGILLLDGPTGRVLRQSRPGAVDDMQPGDPLAGSSLASFVAMVCLQWEYMRAYTTSGGLDGADLLAELTSWLSALDPAAATTRNWGHVLDSDNFPYL